MIFRVKNSDPVVVKWKYLAALNLIDNFIKLKTDAFGFIYIPCGSVTEMNDGLFCRFDITQFLNLIKITSNQSIFLDVYVSNFDIVVNVDVKFLLESDTNKEENIWILVLLNEQDNNSIYIFNKLVENNSMIISFKYGILSNEINENDWNLDFLPIFVKDLYDLINMVTLFKEFKSSNFYRFIFRQHPV